MGRRKDRLLLQVDVSFEATRLAPQHLIAVYTQLVPTVRRTNSRQKCESTLLAPAIVIKMAAGGET